MADLDPLFAAIDRENSEDPHDFDGTPLALAQGRMAESWVRRLDPTASDAVRLAARAHHLRRWAVPRATYPEGRNGYLRWRRDQKARHAEDLGALLTALGPPEEVIRRACVIVQKTGLGHDPEVQTFEDAVSLTFIETQFLSTADKLADDDKMVEVVTKTLRKMSPAAIAAAGSIHLDERAARIVALAMQQLS